MTKYLDLPVLKEGTIADYWMEQGYSTAEARQLERDQIQELLEEEDDIFESLEYTGWQDTTERKFGCFCCDRSGL